MHAESLLAYPKQSLMVISFCSEWVIGSREELVKDIIAEIKPENDEVIFKFILHKILKILPLFIGAHLV